MQGLAELLLGSVLQPSRISACPSTENVHYRRKTHSVWNQLGICDTTKQVFSLNAGKGCEGFPSLPILIWVLSLLTLACHSGLDNRIFRALIIQCKTFFFPWLHFEDWKYIALQNNIKSKKYQLTDWSIWQNTVSKGGLDSFWIYFSIVI